MRRKLIIIEHSNKKLQKTQVTEKSWKNIDQKIILSFQAFDIVSLGYTGK